MGGDPSAGAEDDATGGCALRVTLPGERACWRGRRVCFAECVSEALRGDPCKCHGVPTIWHRDANAKAGGRWRCRVKVQTYHRRYNGTQKRRESVRRYEETAKAIRRKVEHDLFRGREPRGQQDRLEEREAYEASGSALSFLDWLRVERPLAPLRPIR